MSTSISNTVQRLNSLLPLKLRQAALPSELANVHRATLVSLATQGRPPNREELHELLAGGDVDAALTRLAVDPVKPHGADILVTKAAVFAVVLL